MYCRTPVIRTLVIRTVNYPDRLDPSGKFVENSTKQICHEITDYRNKYSTALRFLELQIRRSRKVETPVRSVNSNSPTSNCQCNIFSKKNPIIRMLCIFGCLAIPVNANKWSCTVHIVTSINFSCNCLLVFSYIHAKTRP